MSEIIYRFVNLQTVEPYIGKHDIFMKMYASELFCNHCAKTKNICRQDFFFLALETLKMTATLKRKKCLPENVISFKSSPAPTLD